MKIREFLETGDPFTRVGAVLMMGVGAAALLRLPSRHGTDQIDLDAAEIALAQTAESAGDAEIKRKVHIGVQSCRNDLAQCMEDKNPCQQTALECFRDTAERNGLSVNF